MGNGGRRTLGGAAARSARAKANAGETRTSAGSVPRADSRLRPLDDPTDPMQAWRAFGGTRESVEAVLRDEPAGVLEVMANHANLRGTGSAPRAVRDPGAQRARLAYNIAARLDSRVNGTPLESPAPTPTIAKAASAKSTTAPTPKAPRGAGRLTLDQAHEQMARAVAGGDRAQVLAAAKALVAADTAAKRAATRASGPKRFDALTPVGPVDLSKLRPSGTMEPYALHTALGTTQTRAVLNDLMMTELKGSAAIVERRSGTRIPSGRVTKAALVDYIMEHVGRE